VARLTRGTRPWVSLVAGVMLGLLAAVSLQGVTRGQEDQTAVPTSTAAATPLDAVATYVEARGQVFAGPCEQTRSPEDVGKVCARRVESRGAVEAYLIGRTFSEFSTWVFVSRESGGWAVAGSAPLDFHDLSMTIPWPR
jgi:hypothetical protein